MTAMAETSGETVDVAPTIGGLLGVATPDRTAPSSRPLTAWIRPRSQHRRPCSSCNVRRTCAPARSAPAANVDSSPT